MWQQLLQKHHQKQVQAGQVEEGHLQLQLGDSEIYDATYAQDPLDQAEDAGFGFLQKETYNTKVVKVRSTIYL